MAKQSDNKYTYMKRTSESVKKEVENYRKYLAFTTESEIYAEWGRVTEKMREKFEWQMN